MASCFANYTEKLGKQASGPFDQPHGKLDYSQYQASKPPTPFPRYYSQTLLHDYPSKEGLSVIQAKRPFYHHHITREKIMALLPG